MQNKKNNSIDIGKGLALLSQLAISILTPLLLFVFGAKYLVEKFNIGKWLIPVALIIGLLSGLMSAWNLAQASLRQQAKIQAQKNKDTGLELLEEAKKRIQTPLEKEKTEGEDKHPGKNKR